MSEDRITQRTVTVVMGVIAVLAFVFSFGNVWALALRLGVPGSVAPLIAPMVDLSVVGLLVALRYLSLRGVPATELKAATRLMHLSGLLTLALNIAEPLVARHYGRAAVDTVAPLLLLGWGSVGPALLRHFHATTHPTPASAVPDTPEPAPAPVAEPDVAETILPVDTASVPTSETIATPETPAVETPRPVAPLPPAPARVVAPAPKVPAPLLDTARSIAESHQEEHGEPITAVQLKARLGVPLPLATAAHAALTA
ncbi:DUF2637 domain-containing protein [Streptomyces sp. BR1]|uniref:DUF2637 domain-containing protein n=1 Tax=Streptomyces sp. BR1 TaxID=1592323 RepID=UPI00402BF123